MENISVDMEYRNTTVDLHRILLLGMLVEVAVLVVSIKHQNG